MKQKNVTRKTILYLKKTWTLYLMMALPVAFAVVFRYLPMTNISMAFKNFNMFKGVWASPWSDPVFKWFEKAFSTKDFWLALRNTLMLNSLDLVFGFPLPIILALLMNELAYRRYKRVTQAIVYLPHFLSWIIISGIAKQLLAPRSGIVNVLLMKAGAAEPINFLTEKGLYVATYIAFGLWKEMGWNTIIYLAAITGINPELYDAAVVDGASRLRRIWHVTLPGIRSTIIVLLIMNLGRILGSEFDRPYAMTNSLVKSVSDVLSTFVYRVGIRGFQFSLTAAVGIFQSIVCVIFLVAANSLAKKFGERGIW